MIWITSGSYKILTLKIDVVSSEFSQVPKNIFYLSLKNYKANINSVLPDKNIQLENIFSS